MFDWKIKLKEKDLNKESEEHKTRDDKKITLYKK